MVTDLFPTQLSRAASALAVSLVLFGFPQASYAVDQTVIIRFEDLKGEFFALQDALSPRWGDDSPAGNLVTVAVFNASPLGALDIRKSLQPSGGHLLAIRLDSVPYSGVGDFVVDTSLPGVRRYAFMASIDSVPAEIILPRWAHSNRQFLRGLGQGKAVLNFWWKIGDTEELTRCEVKWQTTSPGTIPQDHQNTLAAAMVIRGAKLGGWLESRQDMAQIAVDSASLSWRYDPRYYLPSVLRNKFGSETDPSECLLDLVLETVTPRTFVVLSDPLNMTLKYESIPLRLMESRMPDTMGAQ